MKKMLCIGIVLLCLSVLALASTTYTNIDDQTNTDNGTTGWGSCTTCAGGQNDASVFWMAQNQTTPSVDGASTAFHISGPQFSNALWWYKVGPNSTVSNFKFDFWAQVDANAALYAQALEFDTFQFTGGRRFMFGTQCDYARGVWDVWNDGGNKWVPTSISCPKFVAGDWYHVTWSFHRKGSRTYYDQLTVVQYDSNNNQLASNTYNVGLQESSGTTSWNNLGVQFQLDLNSSGGTCTMWVDEVSLTAW